MDDAAFEAHRRYLGALREAAARHPRPHSHQLAALDREISLAATVDAASYRAASGDLFELTRGAWLDRAANEARVAATVGDPWAAEAAAAEYAAALRSTGHGDWAERVAAGSTRAEELRTPGLEARSAFTRLLLSLVGVGGGEEAAAAYAALRKADPGFAWSRLARQPRYDLRTPWAEPGRKLVGGWIAELDSGGEAARDEAEPADALREIEAGEERWRSELERGGPAGAPGGEVTLDDALATYRALTEALTGDDRVAAATRSAASALVAAGAAASSAPEALARFVADGLLVALAAAPLRATAEDALARQSVWPDPLVEHHARWLLDALAGASTPSEVELISVHGDACFAVEADWNTALLGSLLAPLEAACLYAWDGSEEARSGVEHAAAAAHTLAGVGPRRLLQVPRIADLVARNIVPLAEGDPGELGAFEGEAGFELLREARNWIEATGSSAGELRPALPALLDRAGVAEPEPLGRPVSLWGTAIEVDALAAALERPNRPGIPGLEAVRGSSTEV